MSSTKSEEEEDVRIDEVMTAEGSASALTQLVQLEHARTNRLVRNLSRLSAIFGSIITLTMIMLCIALRHPRAEALVLGFLIGVFLIGIAVTINKTYGLKMRPRMSELKGVWQHNLPIKILSDAEILRDLPRWYLILSGFVLFICGGCIIVGDVMINFNFSYLQQRYKGDNNALACWSAMWMLTALLAFALAMTKKPGKRFRALLVCFLLANLAGSLVGPVLVVACSKSYNGAFTQTGILRGMDERFGIFEMGDEHVLKYPNEEFNFWSTLKYVALDVSVVFFIANAITATLINFELRGNAAKKTKSKLLGIIGIVIVMTAVALDTMLLKINGTPTMGTVGFGYKFRMVRIVLVGLGLFTGLQSLMAFHSAGNFRRFALFFMTLMLVGASIFATHELAEFHSEATSIEDKALEPCVTAQNETITDQEELFCVYNSTLNAYGNYRDGKYDYEARMTRYIYPPPPLACISKERYCDGKPDLISKKEDFSKIGFSYALCPRATRYSSKFRMGEYEPADEATCYAETYARILVLACFGLLVLDMMLSVVILVATATALPTVISTIFKTMIKMTLFLFASAETGGGRKASSSINSGSSNNTKPTLDNVSSGDGETEPLAA